jgi:VIT1/CCC1 family predicted Fe2+/Mn2+ transporter
MEEKFLKTLLKYQKSELIDYIFYKKLAEKVKYKDIQKILEKLSKEELKHYNLLKEITKQDLKLNFLDKLKLKFYDFLTYLLGVAFAIRLAEKNELEGIERYQTLNLDKKLSNTIESILKDERIHEKELLNLINDERVKNLDAIVLGINDALVELTGALVGMAGVIDNTLKAGFSGLIVGISAALSMAASSFLSKKAETDDIKKAIKSGLYTGIAYLITVIILVYPFFIVKSSYLASLWTVLNAIFVIFLYSYYYSIVKEKNFMKEFILMSSIVAGVSLISFILGKLVDNLFLS